MRDKLKKLAETTSVWYIGSSLLAFVIEYLLTLILSALFLASFEMEDLLANDIAMAIAWICSSNVNFIVNRTLVFRSDAPVLPAYLKYFALALPVFLLKSLGLVNLMLTYTGLPMWIAYPAAQIVMFIVTYLVQKKLIFKLKKKEPRDSDESKA